MLSTRVFVSGRVAVTASRSSKGLLHLGCSFRPVINLNCRGPSSLTIRIHHLNERNINKNESSLPGAFVTLVDVLVCSE